MSKFSDEGVIAHALAAMCLTENRPAAAYIGRVIESHDYEHAKLSPSGAHRWMRCPGSHALESSLPFTPRSFEMEVTEDMAAGVQVFLDAVASRLQAYRDAGATLVELHVEQQLPIEHLTGEANATGTGDVVIVVEFAAFEDKAEAYRLIDIVDLKFGRGVVVHAIENEQLRMYASGAIRLFELIYGDFDRVRYGISQPRLRPEIDDEEITIEELRRFEARVQERSRHALATLSERPDALYHHLAYDKDKQCRFCNAKPICPVHQREVAKTVLDDFEDQEITPATVAAAVIRPVSDSNELLAAWMGKLDAIQQWCKAVAAKVEAKILTGEKVPGYKAVQGRKGNRTWSDGKQAEDLLHKMRVREDVMYDFSLISPSEAEKRFKNPGEYVPKREGAKPFKIRGTVWKSLAPLIGQKDGSPTVVPESDPRPALEIQSPVEDFETVTTEEELF